MTDNQVSPPAVKRVAVVKPTALPVPRPAGPQVKQGMERVAGAGVPERLGWRGYSVSDEALETARTDAPGWDMQRLRAKFLEWANNLAEPLGLATDKAFVRWVPKFTKGKPPP